MYMHTLCVCIYKLPLHSIPNQLLKWYHSSSVVGMALTWVSTYAQYDTSTHSMHSIEI